jgi:hypothetical protein
VAIEGDRHQRVFDARQPDHRMAGLAIAAGDLARDLRPAAHQRLIARLAVEEVAIGLLGGVGRMVGEEGVVDRHVAQPRA